jgi:ribonuclease G
MKKEIYVSESAGETRIAILEEDKLVEVYVEKHGQHRMVSNIYKGKVENVLPGMQAAFVDIGYDLNAFLPFSEIHNDEYIIEEIDNETSQRKTRKNSDHRRNKNNNPEINVDLHPGQEIFVQVIKEPFASKGPRVTTEIAIPGRLLVLVPNANYVGISKKLWDKYERRRLKKIVTRLREKDFGLIIRTVAEGKAEEQISKDYDLLMTYWRKLMRKAEKSTAPALIYEDLETASSVIRDLLTSDVEKITIDSKRLYKKLASYLDDVSPSLANRLQLYKIKAPLFESMGLETEIEKLLHQKVWLKSGAYLVIEKTEAMVVVDVNSGRFVGKQLHEQNSLKINLEAAREIARHLRLRDLSGLIVIDFIDLREDENKKKVYSELRKELKKDRAKVAVSPISEFGLLEMTRQRIRLSLLDSMSEECPTCHGAGRLISKDKLVTRIDHWLRRYKAKRRNLRLLLLVHPKIEEYLKTEKKRALRGLMWQNFVHIRIKADATVPRDEFRFISISTGKDITNELGLDKKHASA